ncbi:MAG TPA: DNA polymerase III subunit gamma/tau, partial [Parvibaculum sp.]
MNDSVEHTAPDAIAEEPGFDLLGGAAKPSSRQQASGYQVLARKYRPTDFDDLVGQEAMVRTLSNAFEAGRIAHAFMLTGVRGVGKTTTARILARALNYEKPGVTGPTIHMDGFGVHCEAIMESRHVDVLEMDAASRTGIDDIREIIESVRYLPVSARYKVYIIDEVHMLSKAAFNGLLKTLEEPPAHVKFIFATTEIRKVPVTVLSRCQRFDLRRLSVDELGSLLSRIAGKENVGVEDAALKMIARAADGSTRDGLSLLDRAISHSASEGDGRILEAQVRDMLGLADRARVFDLFDMLMRGDIASALAELRAQYDVGADPAVVLSDLAELTHWLTRLKLVEAAADDLAMSETERVRGQEMAAKLPIRVLSRTWQMLLKGLIEVQGSSRPIAAAEMVLVRIAYVSDGPGPEELIEQLKGGGALARAAPAPG